MSTLYEYYSGGFAGGVGCALFVSAVFWIIYRRERKKAGHRQRNGNGPDAETSSPLKKAMMESGCYLMIGLVLAAVAYLWITPLASFSGVVEDKTRRVTGRKTKVILHYLHVNGTKREVSKDIYETAEKGDTIIHPPAAQFYDINGKRYVARQFASNTGFWLGIIAACCLALCAGAHYRRFFPARGGGA